MHPYVNLKRQLRVQLEGGYFLCPGGELLGLPVNAVVKDCSVGGELDGLELIHPPFAELHSVVSKLQQAKQHQHKWHFLFRNKYIRKVLQLVLLIKKQWHIRNNSASKYYIAKGEKTV